VIRAVFSCDTNQEKLNPFSHETVIGPNGNVKTKEIRRIRNLQNLSHVRNRAELEILEKSATPHQNRELMKSGVSAKSGIPSGEEK